MGTRTAQAEGPPTVPSTVAFVVLGASFALTAIIVVLAVIATLGRDETVRLVADPHALAPALDSASTLGGMAFLASAAAWISTAWWLIDLRRVADWAAPGHPHRRSSWWALAAWVVPVVSLWFPYQLVADCSRALRSRVTGFWPWWIGWLLMSTGSMVNVPAELATAQDVDRWVLGTQISAVLAVVTFVLWWRIVRSATRAAADAVSEVRVPS